MFDNTTLLTENHSRKFDLNNGALSKIIRESRFDAVLITRPDLIFKPLFEESLRAANRENLLYSFREWKYPHFPYGDILSRYLCVRSIKFNHQTIINMIHISVDVNALLICFAGSHQDFFQRLLSMNYQCRCSLFSSRS